MITEADFKQAIVNLRSQEISAIVKTALDAGIPPLTILNSLKSGLDVVGNLYHNGEFFLSQLYMAGETMSAAMEVLMPALVNETTVEEEGIVVLGSIEGDIHDFGKEIVKTFLIAAGFTVHDLGIDVPPVKFIEEAVARKADIIGISALLSSTQPTSEEVVQLLKERGLREKFKVILGGTGVTERAITEYGVDAAVNDATEGERIMKQWMVEKRS